MATEIKVPTLGESVTEATVSKWMKSVGDAVAAGVDALSKRPHGPDGERWSKAEKMTDSLARICEQPREVWVVKLADRVTNLQTPPAHWSGEKIATYHREAEQIFAALKGASPHLAERLRQKLEAYTAHWA